MSVREFLDIRPKTPHQLVGVFSRHRGRLERNFGRLPAPGCVIEQAYMACSSGKRNLAQKSAAVIISTPSYSPMSSRSLSPLTM